MTHAVAEAYGQAINHTIICTCGASTGPCASPRQAREVWTAHAAGTPIESPVRPLLLAGVQA